MMGKLVKFLYKTIAIATRIIFKKANKIFFYYYSINAIKLYIKTISY